MEHLLIYPVKKGYLDPELIKNVATSAEKNGFHAFLSWDHYMLPEAPDTLDAWNMLSYVCGLTSQIKLGTVVTPIPFRPPSHLAKITSTLDHLSNGRSILGVGAGWHKPEFEGFSEWGTPGERVSKTEEALDLITNLWTGKPVKFTGKYYNSTNGEICPVPIQASGPPLWFGVRGKRMLRLAAKYGEAWIPTNIKSDEYARGLQQLRNIQESMGIKHRMKGALQNFTAFEESSKFIETINMYGSAGCEYYGTVWSYPPNEMVERIEWYAKTIMPETN